MDKHPALKHDCQSESGVLWLANGFFVNIFLVGCVTQTSEQISKEGGNFWRVAQRWARQGVNFYSLFTPSGSQIIISNVLKDYVAINESVFTLESSSRSLRRMWSNVDRLSECMNLFYCVTFVHVGQGIFSRSRWSCVSRIQRYHSINTINLCHQKIFNERNS